MKLKNFLLILILMIVQISCSASDTKTEKIEIIRECIHKYDSSIKIIFYEKNMKKFVLNDIPMFYIVDINGKDFFLNIYEIENYICGVKQTK